MTSLFRQQYESTPLQGANASYVEALYEAWLEDPNSVTSTWRKYFGSIGKESTANIVETSRKVQAALEELERLMSRRVAARQGQGDHRRQAGLQKMANASLQGRVRYHRKRLASSP